MLIGEATLAIAISVLMHVTWNLYARHQPRDAHPIWWVLLVHIIALGPWGLYSLATEITWNAEFALLLGLSAVANTLYFIALRQAYVNAPVALVYPLVRSSPLFIAIWSTLIFGDILSRATWLGIAISVAGLLILASTAWRNRERLAIPWAVVAMLSTSIYSLSDKAATAHLVSFGGVLGFITVGFLLSWSAVSIQIRRETGLWRPAITPRPASLIVGGLSVGLAYALVIHAMRFLPAAEVVAYTNAGIVIASLISMTVFGEHSHWRTRTMGILWICVGLTTLAVNR